MYLRDLEYYQELIIQKNFSKVASFFGVSQPAISAAIKRLENELDTQLFVRDHSHNELHVTLAGQQLNIHAKQILTEWGITKAEIKRLSKNSITIGLPPIIRNYYFTNLALSFKKNNILTNIQTIESGSNNLRSLLLHGNLDIALLGSIEPLAYKTLTTEEFSRHPFQIFVSKNHPYANKKLIQFTDLKAEDFILLNENFIHTEAINKLASRNHMRIKPIFQSSDVSLIMNMVAANLGITFLAGITNPHRNDIVALTLVDHDQPLFITSIAYQSNHVFSPTQKQVLELLRTDLK